MSFSYLSGAEHAQFRGAGRQNAGFQCGFSTGNRFVLGRRKVRNEGK
jgi:hypothetical protein